MGMSSLAEIGARHRVRLLLQHGSTVSGHVHAGSDLDIAALFEDGQGSLASVIALSADLRMYAFRRYQDHRRFLALERPYVRQAPRRLAAR
jgi:predicted nucleotidyltransferase